MRSGDTIVAISSATGASAARIIVRMSGPDAHRIARALLDSELPEPGSAVIRRLRFRGLSPFQGWTYTFAAPRSVTGEDVIELHLPGNALLARLLLDEFIQQGARHADPGEFTARAFFNGKLDLTEAEGVAAVVSANSQAELDAARRLLAGELARRLAPTLDAIVQTLGLVEAGIDFVDEDITFLPDEQLRTRIDESIASLRSLLDDSSRFERVAHEPQVVLAGRPNAGKSTLLNALAGYERAIVSPVAGTTRDALGATVRLARGLAHVVDVAGVDLKSDSEVERKMRETALRSIETADVVVLMRDVTDDRPPLELPREPDLIVASKCDLRRDPAEQYCVSAVTGQGMDDLRRRLDDLCFGSAATAQAAGLALTARHVRSIDQAVEGLSRARTSTGAEIIALEMREALDALGSILGHITPDAVLDHVFATFCIGK